MTLRAAHDPQTPPDLGEPLEHFSLRTSRLRAYRALAAAGLAGGLVALLLALWRWNYSLRNYGPAVVPRWTAPFLIAAGVSSAIGALALVGAGRGRRLTLSVHAEGLLLNRGGRPLAIGWPSIEAVFASRTAYGVFGLQLGRRTACSLLLADGRRLRLDSRLDRMSRLVDLIREHLYPRLIHGYRQKLRAGEELSFGPLSIGKRGVALGRRTIAWDANPRAALQAGKLQLSYLEDGELKRVALPAHRIPNVDLCAQLIERIAP